MYLDRAALTGNSRIALALIKNGANVDSADTSGWTPLHVVSFFEFINFFLIYEIKYIFSILGL